MQLACMRTLVTAQEICLVDITSVSCEDCVVVLFSRLCSVAFMEEIANNGEQYEEGWFYNKKLTNCSERKINTK